LEIEIQRCPFLPVAKEFLDRMAWLPELLKALDKPALLDA